MIPATQNAHSTLQKHCGCPPAAHNAALADAPAGPHRPPGAPHFAPQGENPRFGGNAVSVHGGRGRVGGEGVVGRG